MLPQKCTSLILAFVTFAIIWSETIEAKAYIRSSRPSTTPKPPIYDYIPSKKKQHNAALIFLHRAGLNGTEMQNWVQLLIGATEFNHIKMIFPTAPKQPYTLISGRKRNIWYDQDSFTFNTEEKLNSFEAGAKIIRDIVEYEMSIGIPAKRIIIGGFSMGGIMALHYGYRLSQGLGGVFALSAFLPDNSSIYQSLNETNSRFSLPQLFMATGDSDEFILEKWCDHTFEKLREHRVPGEYYGIRGMLHTMSVQEIIRLWDWIGRVLPDGSEYDVKTTPEDSGTDEDYYGDMRSTKFKKIIV